MQEKKTEEIQLRADLASEEKRGQQLSTLEKTLTSAVKERGAVEKYLFDPSEENQIKLVSSMEELGSETTGAMVNTTSLEMVSGKPKILHGEFIVSGTWTRLYHVLRLVETMPMNTVVTRFNVTNSNGGEWTGGLGVDFVSIKIE